MYIIDKNKDYYDYLKGIYGIDKTITYDRRGSVVLSEFSLLNQLSNAYTLAKELHNLISTKHFVLEIGTVQYIFQTKITYKKDKFGINDAYIPVSGKYKIIGILKEHQHYFDKEISIVPFRLNFLNNHYYWDYWYYRNKNKEEKEIEIKTWSEVTDIQTDKIIVNPILTNTSIASFIPPMDIWIELNNYISSKYNDKIIEIVNTDKDKVINHGFDTKSSFRHPVK
jgi:hypothetical protein